MNEKSVYAVVGGQFGSEGKGAVVAAIADRFQHHVRVGAANAGHTFYTEDNPGSYQKHVMQQLPCAAYANPDADLYIGPGALISYDILLQEIRRNANWRRSRKLDDASIWIDHRAHVITADHIREERESGLAERIGSTSATAREGIGAAQAARVMRSADCVQVKDVDTDWGGVGRVRLIDVPRMLAARAESGERVMLEGTQGYGLSLTTGRHPWVTSRNTTAAGLCADCGVAPNRVGGVCLVIRTYPIRVAGPSGPFHPESQEICWEDIGVDPKQELTTVTRKVRRVATFSHDQVAMAAKVNGATSIALMFADYIDPTVAGKDSIDESAPIQEFIRRVERGVGVPVTLIGTGPRTIIRRKPPLWAARWVLEEEARNAI